MSTLFLFYVGVLTWRGGYDISYFTFMLVGIMVIVIFKIDWAGNVNKVGGYFLSKRDLSIVFFQFLFHFCFSGSSTIFTLIWMFLVHEVSLSFLYLLYVRDQVVS